MTPMRKMLRFKPQKESTTSGYIGLGSNLGERESTIRRAVEQLDDGERTQLVRLSALRETDPVGYEDQPRFLNGVAIVATTLSPAGLLERLLEIERSLGRDRSRSERWGPRPIDLDLLLYGDEVVDEPGLRVPHPRLHERRFVLEPLAELDPGLVVPGYGRVSDLLAKLESG
jgi:2-amino-4-hydroxy-6-hydroxymethyldihydropteridine diphosphokinase